MIIKLGKRGNIRILLLPCETSRKITWVIHLKLCRAVLSHYRRFCWSRSFPYPWQKCWYLLPSGC